MRISRRQILAWPIALAAAPVRPLMVGDSLAHMARPHASDFDIVAEGGSNARQWLKKRWMKHALARHRPSVLVMSLGTNDAGVPALLRELPRNAGLLVQIGLDAGARVVWLVPPNRRGPRAARAVMGSGAEICFPPADVELYPKDVHPTARGYETWLTAVREFLG